MSEWKETEIGKMPAEWALKKIKEISERVSVGYVGITSKYFTNDSDGIPLLRSQNIRNGKINFDNLLYITKEFHYANKKSILQSGDVLVVRVGENRGDTCILKNEFKEVNCANIVFFRPQKEYGKFIELFLRSPYGQFTLEALTTGSAQGVINTTSIAEISVPLPSMEEAVEISALFESIENKIDLLHRQNKTLEQLAETLFRQWFVEEAEVQSDKQLLLGNLIESVSITNKFPSDKVIFLNTSDIYLGDVLVHESVDVFSLPGQAKKTIQKEDILFSEIRPANGRYAYINFDAENYVVSTKLMVLRSKNVLSQAFIYFYLTNSQTVNWLQVLAESRSGTFPQITFDQLRDLKINIPSDEILDDAIKWCETAITKIKSNTTQISTLTQLRDTLLPKLMSGEVSVNMN